MKGLLVGSALCRTDPAAKLTVLAAAAPLHSCAGHRLIRGGGAG